MIKNKTRELLLILLTAAILTPLFYWILRNALPFYACIWAVLPITGPLGKKYLMMHPLSYALFIALVVSLLLGMFLAQS